jgi:serine/threonine protein kinase
MCYTQRERLGISQQGYQLSRGTHAATGSHVSILTIDKRESKVDTSQLKREVKVLSKVGHHPNVVSLREVLHSRSKVHLVSQLCVSDTLEHMMQQPEKHLDGLTANRFFVQLVAGLQHLHGAGIVHCNIKPESVLLDSHNTLMIGNFSSASTEMRVSAALPRFCTPYSAPEVFKSERYNGQRSDIWSAGVVLYTWLAGFTPFQGASVGELFSSISSGSFQWPKGFSKELKHLISGMLTVDPWQRMTLQQIRCHPWLQCRDSLFGSSSSSSSSRGSSSVNNADSAIRRHSIATSNSSSSERKHSGLRNRIGSYNNLTIPAYSSSDDSGASSTTSSNTSSASRCSSASSTSASEEPAAACTERCQQALSCTVAV